MNAVCPQSDEDLYACLKEQAENEVGKFYEGLIIVNIQAFKIDTSLINSNF